MEAIRAWVKVIDRMVTIRLPDHFDAKRVEVIVLAADDALLSPAPQPTDRRHPSPLLAGTRIVGDIMLAAVEADDWDALT